ncbi:hypothetical protein ACIPW9_30440 [Streptomyces sp. NPDC090052]|uniref:hypothetical protein n=1 Tax=Streptomyces sp. NPDC090052 TaxID=3365931 RepID=UPI0037FD2574
MSDAMPEPPGAQAGSQDGQDGPGGTEHAPAPLGVVRTPTGNDGVDRVLGRLADADHLAADGHVEVYEDVHRGLRAALDALDAPPGPPAPARGPAPHEVPQNVPHNSRS